MWKIIWTTIFWALILVIAWFYLKFMDQDMGQQVSNWIMSVETTTDTDTETLSGDVVDPMQVLLSWVTVMQQQLVEGLSGLNMKLDETKTLIEDGAKPKVTSPAATPKSDTKEAKEVKEVKEPVATWTWA